MSESFLERFYTENHDKICRVIARRLFKINYELSEFELKQESFDLWWESFDRLNKLYKKGTRITSDEHARRIMYKIIPFIVRQWAHKRIVNNSFPYSDDGTVYNHPIAERERERQRKSTQDGSHSYEKRKIRNLLRVKKQQIEIKKDPVKYRAFLDYRNKKRNERYLLRKLGKYVDRRRHV